MTRPLPALFVLPSVALVLTFVCGCTPEPTGSFDPPVDEVDDGSDFEPHVTPEQARAFLEMDNLTSMTATQVSEILGRIDISGAPIDAPQSAEPYFLGYTLTDYSTLLVEYQGYTVTTATIHPAP